MKKLRYQRVIGILLCIMLVSSGIFAASAANLPAPPKDSGIITLLKAVRPLGTIASVINSAVHPDDEQSALLAALSLGQGVDTVILNVTRGQGGQNAIGPEYQNAMGVLRTMEMDQNIKILHTRNQWGRYDFDSPCMDYGFSKMWEEAEELWDFDYIADYLALNIRRYRPQVCVHHAQNIRTEHGQHQAMYITFQMGIERAADPSRNYEDLPAYQVPKVYERCPKEDQTVTVNVGAYDPWYGQTYNQIAQYARSFHACQGMGGNPFPGPVSAYFMMTNEGAQKIKSAGQETSFFDGLPYDFDDYAKLVNDEAVRELLTAVQADYRAVDESFPDTGAVLSALTVMQEDVKKALDAVSASSIMSDNEKYDASFLLNRKLEQLDEALAAANAVSVRVIMDDYEIVPGQEANVSVRVYQGTGKALELADVQLNLPDGWTIVKGEQEGSLGDNQTVIQHFTILADDTAELYNAFHGNMLTATASFASGFKAYGKPEKTFALLPEFSVEMGVDKVALNTARELKPIKSSIKVTNLSTQSTEATVAVEAPEGWMVSPATVKENFGPGEAKMFDFEIMAPEKLTAGAYEIKGVVNGVSENRQTVQTIDYPHIDKAFYLYDSVSTVQAFPLEFDDNLKIGYISSGSDTVGETLQMLGMNVTFLTENDIRFADLSQYDTIATGIRAYKNLKWLKEVNGNLLAYANDGGNLVIQYHTSGDGYTPDLAPYPLKVGSPSLAWRITREDSPVTVLLPDSPILNTPNKLDGTAWDNWIQERSLYIPMEWDSAYETPIRSGLVDQEGAEYDGQILTADYGKGRFTYTAIVFFRQVPGLVPGGVQLFTNILSQ